MTVMKQVAANILGQAYMLGCPEGSEAQLHAAVAVVDREMSAIRDSGKVKARERIAVLAALNLALQRVEAAQAPAAAPSGATQGEAAPLSGEHSETIASLVRRIDTALGGDGRLL
jgi:cell division protein ZapA